VIGTPKTVDEPVMVRLKKNEKFKNQQSKADAARPASAGDLRRQVNDMCRIAGVVMINDSLVGTHALRRGTAFDLNYVPTHLWKAGTNAGVSALLGHSSANIAKGLAIRYADAATEDAHSARESVLPALEDDGTTWAQRTSRMILMVGPVENISPPGWTFEDDRLAVTKMSETVPMSTAQTRVKEFWQWKGKMRTQSASCDVPLSMGKRLGGKFNSTSFASEEKYADLWLLSLSDLGHAGLCAYLIQSKYEEVQETPSAGARASQTSEHTARTLGPPRRTKLIYCFKNARPSSQKPSHHSTKRPSQHHPRT
jgi:hypothetical protein